MARETPALRGLGRGGGMLGKWWWCPLAALMLPVACELGGYVALVGVLIWAADWCLWRAWR